MKISKVNNKKYNLGFVGGALLYGESVLIAEKYLEVKDWAEVKSIVEKANLLQARTQSSGKRICREVILRLQNLSIGELTRFVSSEPNEQGLFLWIAICLRYKFIADFAEEVLRERFVRFNRNIE